MAVGAPAMASTPTRPAPGAEAPVASRSVTISCSCDWTLMPAMLLCAVATMALAACAPVAALTCVLRKPRSAASCVFTLPAASAFGAPADASTPPRVAPEEPPAPVVRSSPTSSMAACTLAAPTKPSAT